MTKRVAVQLVADGNAFVASTEKTLGTMRQQFADAGRQINQEFTGIFKNGASEAERAVRASMAQIENLTKSANLTNGGLQFDKGALTAELTTAKQYLATQQQVAAALDRVAAEEGQAGAAARVRAEAQRLSIAATEEQVRGILQEITLLDRLQGELGQTVTQQRRLATVSGEARAGTQQFSYNIGDFFTQVSMGQGVLMAFTAQFGQTIQAIQLMTGKTTGLIGFLGGPWGTALTGAAMVAGMLSAKLLDNSEAAKEAEKAQEALASKVADIATFFDRATGAVIRNSEALIANARLQRLDEIDNIRKAVAERNRAAASLVRGSMPGTVQFGGTFGNETGRASITRAGPSDIVRAINAAGGDQKKMGDALVGIARGSGENAARARALIDLIGKDKIDLDQLKKLTLEEESLRSGQLARDLMKPSTSPRRGGGGAKGVDPARAAETMSNKLREAYESAVQLRGQFDEMPSDIDRANNALIDAQQRIEQAQKALSDPKVTGENKKLAEDTLRVATEAKALAEAAPSKPFTDNLETLREQIDAQRLLIDGRTAEYHTMQDQLQLAKDVGAEHLSQVPTLLEKRKITAADVAEHQRLLAIQRLQSYQLQRQQEEEQKLLDFVRDREDVAKQTIYDVLDGRGVNAFKSTIRSLGEIARREMTEQVFKAVFGDYFEKQKLKILGLDKVDESGKRLSASIDKTVPPIRELGDAALEAAQKLRSAAVASNDNGITSPKGLAKMAGAESWPLGDIIVSAPHAKENNAVSEIKKLTKVTSDGLSQGGTLSKGLSGIGKAFSGAMRGAAIGEATSGVLRSLGLKQSRTGAQIGGAIGSFLPIPGGEIIGSVIGGTIGGLFKKTPRGYATIGAGGIASTGGNSKAAREAGTDAAGETMDSLEAIAKALGGTFDPSRGSVSIGRSGDSWHVDTTGRGRLKKSQGGLDFNDDYDAAVRAATLDLIKDGVITGISAAAQRVLQSGKDLQQAIEKASVIESIPKLLKARTNPVAAALDDLNDKWDRTVAILKEGAASAQQYADAEKLYQLEREEILKAANDNLKEFINGLNFGPNSGLSLRDQSANARAQLQPYLAAIQSGNIEGIDRDKYLAAADSFLQISRALNGSGSGYFATVDELRQATQSLLDQTTTGTGAAQARDPFAEVTAKATQASANLLDDQNKLLIEQNKWLEKIAAMGGGGFIGANRKFA